MWISLLPAIARHTQCSSFFCCLPATLSLARRTGVRRFFFKHKTPGQSHLSLTWPKGRPLQNLPFCPITASGLRIIFVSIQRVLYYRPFASLIRVAEYAEGFILLVFAETRLPCLSSRWRAGAKINKPKPFGQITLTLIN